MTDQPSTNGEFKGGVNARLGNIEHQLGGMWKSIDDIKWLIAEANEKAASTRTHVKVLWGGFGFIVASIAALAIKVLFTGGAS